MNFFEMSSLFLNGSIFIAEVMLFIPTQNMDATAQ